MLNESQPSSGSKSRETILIGVAWPYANGYIHLGHIAGSLLSPDIFSRYHRMRGDKVLMVSGSDEHGTPITVRAELEGKSPREIVDFFHAQTLRDLGNLKIEFDLFTRTTHPNHRKVVQDLFLTLYKQGYVYPRTTLELYCKKCDKFLPDRYVTGTCPHCGQHGARGDQCDACSKTYNAVELIDPVCKLCDSTPEPKETEHFFFKLSAFNQKLLTYLENKDHWKSRVLNFTRNWITEGLKDRPITRDISWGVPVPLEGYEKKSVYVWFDAVIGYLSTSKLWAEESGTPDAWKEFWLTPDVKSYYFLGKDNIPFHTIIWPAMLIGYSEGKGEKYDLPYDVPANEYLRLGGEKFTKSGGIGVEVVKFMKEYTSDEVRYYLSIIMPENRDADFDMGEFRTHINNELVATFGNFIHRVISFTARNFGSIPRAGTLSESDLHALEEIGNTAERTGEYIERCEFKNGLKEIMSLAAYGNRYLGERAPWHLIKSNREECDTVLNVGMRIVKALSVIAYPYLPEGMARLHGYLGMDGTPTWDEATKDFTTGQYAMELAHPKPLFRILEQEKTAGQSPKKDKKAKKSKKVKTKDRQIHLEDLELKVGLVRDVRDHPDAEKLYIMSIDIGEEEPRTLVAGLKPYYPPEGLSGKHLVIVCNLRSASLRGVLSRGMLLAADKNGVISFITPETEQAPGTPVTGHLTSGASPLEEITIKEFASIPMTVRRVEHVDHGNIVLDNGEEIENGDLEALKLIGRKVVIARGNILMTKAELVIPEREIEVGAGIR